MSLDEILVKKALKKDYFANHLFGGMYNMSPYMGCSHGCIYCDGRAEKYHFEGDFVKDVKVRTNLPELLEKEIIKVREIAPIHLSSGISDIYQHMEKKYNLTGRCSKILSDYNFHVSVLTKSSLVLRDYDNWIKVNKKGGFTLQMTMTTLDDKIRKIMEPGASSVDERLETIKIFKDAGCNVGIYMMPLLPGITDDFNGITRLVERLQDLNVDYIMPWTLTLRPGKQKDIYINTISKTYSELMPLYSDIFSENKVSGSPKKSYENNFFNKINPIFKDINQFIPHYLYRNTMPIYCEIVILLQHMIFLYQSYGVDITRLNKSYRKLITYLESQKKRFNQKRSLPASEIDDQLKFIIITDSLNNLIDNQKLSVFIKEVVIERKIFNYKTMILE